MELTELMATDPEFNLKVLLYGDSKLGKTTLVAHFTRGPIHFDFFDPNGAQALIKMVKAGLRTAEGVSFEQFDYKDPKSFDKYWKHIQKLDKEGFFKKLAEEKGLYVVDSYTALNLATMAKVMLTSKNTLPSQPDFRENKGYIMNFIQTVTTLPCAVVVIAHTETSKDEASGSVKILPMVTGSLKTSSGVFFDDLLFMKMRGKDRVVTAKPSAKANAGSRVLPEEEYVNFNMNDYFDYHMTGKFSDPKKFKAATGQKDSDQG